MEVIDTSYIELAGDTLYKNAKARSDTYRHWVKKYDAAGVWERWNMRASVSVPRIRWIAEQDIEYHADWLRENS